MRKELSDQFAGSVAQVAALHDAEDYEEFSGEVKRKKEFGLITFREAKGLISLARGFTGVKSSLEKAGSFSAYVMLNGIKGIGLYHVIKGFTDPMIEYLF